MNDSSSQRKSEMLPGRPPSRPRTLVSLLIGAAVLVAAILARPQSPATISTPGLADLQGIPDLQTRFNADAGQPRLILLLSPT